MRSREQLHMPASSEFRSSYMYSNLRCNLQTIWLAMALTLALLKASSCPAATNSARISWDHVQALPRRELRKSFDGGRAGSGGIVGTWATSSLRGREGMDAWVGGGLAGIRCSCSCSRIRIKSFPSPYHFSTWSLLSFDRLPQAVKRSLPAVPDRASSWELQAASA